MVSKVLAKLQLRHSWRGSRNSVSPKREGGIKCKQGSLEVGQRVESGDPEQSDRGCPCSPPSCAVLRPPRALEAVVTDFHDNAAALGGEVTVCCPWVWAEQAWRKFQWGRA